MVNVETEGFRPTLNAEACRNCTDCLEFCPGATVDGDLATGSPQKSTKADHDFGSTLEIYEGWASDSAVRNGGSSGGVLSALSLYCLEQGGFAGVVHAGMDPSTPWLNANHVSRVRSEVLARAGSRYAPSDPCAGLQDIREEAGTFAFIAKPCDTSAVTALARTDPRLQAKLGAVLTFFCAGTPSTRGTLDLMAELGARASAVEAVHYRGNGWPGSFRIVSRERHGERELSYQDSWSRLTAYRPLRCNLCPDGLGRVADIACGDAWHHFKDDGDPGRSLILVRTERGRSLLEGAIRAGYVTVQPATADDVSAAQVNLVGRRRLVFGRLLGLSLIGSPTPRFRGFHLFRGWMSVKPWEQFTSVAGTLRRALSRHWYQRRPPTGDTLEAEHP